MTYDEYLASPCWTGRKAAVIRARGYACERCRATSRLELHHKTYARLFHERPEDVQLLCHRCHSTEHGLTPKPPGRDLEDLATIIARLFADKLPAPGNLEVKDGIVVTSEPSLATPTIGGAK